MGNSFLIKLLLPTDSSNRNNNDLYIKTITSDPFNYFFSLSRLLATYFKSFTN